MSIKKINQALDAYKRGNLQQAADLFEKVQKKLKEPQQIHASIISYLQTNRPDRAEQALKQLVALVKTTAMTLSLSGDINKAKNDLPAALADYQRAVQLAPKLPELKYNLALCLYQSAEPRQAETVLRDALALRPDYVKSLVLLARCLAALEDFDQAHNLLTRACSLEPNNYLSHYRLGRLETHRGNNQAARDALEKTLAIQPDLTVATETLLLNSIYSGDHSDTKALIDAGLAKHPGDQSLIGVATDWATETGMSKPNQYIHEAWLKQASPRLFSEYFERLMSSSKIEDAEQLLGSYEMHFSRDLSWEAAKLKLLEANQHFEESVSLIKGSQYKSQHQVQNCIAHFALGDYGTSYDCAKALCDSQPKDQYFMALWATALRCLGDPRYHELVDYNNLLLETNLQSQFLLAQQFSEFRMDLAKQMHALHTTTSAPTQQSVTGGTQTPGNLFAQCQQPIVQQLKQKLQDASMPFLKRLGTDRLSDSHPVRRGYVDEPYFNTSWSIRTFEGGFHKSHIHSKGWYSSACYIEVPTVVSDQSDAGYLLFGQPPFITKDLLAPDYRVKPIAGELVLFPSYFWHATRPYQGVGSRLVVAFDVGCPNQFV